MSKKLVDKTVLIVEGDRTERNRLSRLLSRKGCYVKCAKDLRSAYRIIEHDAPACILLDVDMPHVDLQSFYSRLSEIDGNSPIIVMTADGAALKKARTSFDVLKKPIGDDDLVHTIRETLT